MILEAPFATKATIKKYANKEKGKRKKMFARETRILRVKNLTHLFGTPVGNDDIFH